MFGRLICLTRSSDFFHSHALSHFSSSIANRPLWPVCFVFPIEAPGELDPLSFHKLCVDMHVNKTKFEKKKKSPECYHMTCIGETKHTS